MLFLWDFTLPGRYSLRILPSLVILTFDLILLGSALPGVTLPPWPYTLPGPCPSVAQTSSSPLLLLLFHPVIQLLKIHIVVSLLCEDRGCSHTSPGALTLHRNYLLTHRGMDRRVSECVEER